MSHRKFEAPRHGNLGFSPRKRSKSLRGRVRRFPKDKPSAPCHLTAFMGYKAAMTHVVRDLDKPGSLAHKKEILEPVTIIEVPEMVAFGVVGYVETPRGLRTLTTVFAQNISPLVMRSFYKNWYNSKRKAFTRYSKDVASGKLSISDELARITRHCQVVRVLAYTRIDKTPLRQKRPHIMEIQVNGGNTHAKVNFAKKLLEQPFKVSDVFAVNEMVDICGVTKGGGYEGTTARFGTKRLRRKTHRGLRKVACIGAWGPHAVNRAVARAGQNGHHHRTEINKKIYRIGAGISQVNGVEVFDNASTPADPTPKNITAMGGFTHYGEVRNDYVMFKGSIVGPKKRVITLRKTLINQTSRNAVEQVELKFIDTSSKYGHGRFQTSDQKSKYLGTRKRDLIDVDAPAV